MSNKQPSFGEAYEELQQLTKEFEQNNLDLEKAIPKYKRASELAQYLKKRLQELEVQIKEVNLANDTPSIKEPENISNADSDINF
jgi:exodeoxyribonuclease VII small subunit